MPACCACHAGQIACRRRRITPQLARWLADCGHFFRASVEPQPLAQEDQEEEVEEEVEEEEVEEEEVEGWGKETEKCSKSWIL